MVIGSSMTKPNQWNKRTLKRQKNQCGWRNEAKLEVEVSKPWSPWSTSWHAQGLSRMTMTLWGGIQANDQSLEEALFSFSKLSGLIGRPPVRADTGSHFMYQWKVLDFYMGPFLNNANMFATAQQAFSFFLHHQCYFSLSVLGEGTEGSVVRSA